MLAITLFSLVAALSATPGVFSQDLDDAGRYPRPNITALCSPPSGRTDVFYYYMSGDPKDITYDAENDLTSKMSLGMHYSQTFCTKYMELSLDRNTTEDANFSFLKNWVNVDAPYLIGETQNVPYWIDSYKTNMTEEDYEALIANSDGTQWLPYVRHVNGTETWAGNENYVACSVVGIDAAIDSACSAALGDKDSASLNAGQNLTATVTGKTADPLKLTIAAFKKSTVKVSDCKTEMKALVETYTWRTGYDTPAGNITAVWGYSQDGNVKTKIEWVNRKVIPYWDTDSGDEKDGLWCVKLKEDLVEAEGVATEKGAAAAGSAGEKKDEEESAAESGRQFGWSALALSVAAAWMLV